MTAPDLTPSPRRGAPVRVLVCGGRDYKDRQAVYDALDELHRTRGVACVIEGGARGADMFARQWARHHGIPLETYAAEWILFGPIAGPMRNNRMLVEGQPDLVVAFPGGRGTASMVRKARSAGVPVIDPAALAAAASGREGES